jgi:predicted alpha/beta superfamily hydrolase
MFVGFDFPMKNLSRNRHITVYLPDDYYRSDKRYPVMYIQDGQNAFFDSLSYAGVSWGFVDYCKQANLDIILVAIECNTYDKKREDEYGPWVINEELSYLETKVEGKRIGGEGKLYVEWMVYALKPYIDKRFRTIQDDSAIVGSSMGGVIASYASLAYPHIFKKCASLSTAYWFYYDEFKDLIESSDLSEIDKFYFDLGEFEGCGDEMIDQWYFESNDFIYDLIKDKIDNIEYQYFEGAAHNEVEWRKRVPIFMDYFYFNEKEL